MIHVAIVSHGHESLLISSAIGGLQDAVDGIHVWLKDNLPSAALKEHCHQHGVSYTDQSPGLGFGANNNFLFELIQNSVGFSQGDIFIVMNPDVTTNQNTLFELVKQMHADQAKLATLNLYRDAACTTPDANIRRFPDFLSPVRMLWVKSLTEAYDKSEYRQAGHSDWASGAFLAFDADHYRRLQGFDDRYFMYFEDVDLCYRSYLLLGKGVRYYPQLKAIHSAARKNRNIASLHANWFIRSFMKFIFRKYFVYGLSGYAK
jgi:N-acetylglucosaminyl-diphospho-decaprenol L-rhamnosyltransferase